MNQISISSLKKEAKILRKNNDAIKNHNDSLNAIAKKYNFPNWQDLLDGSYINIEKSHTLNLGKSELEIEQIPYDIGFLADKLSNVKEEIKKEYRKFIRLKNRDSEYVTQRIKILVFNFLDYNGDNNMERKKVESLIDYVCGTYFLYTEKLGQQYDLINIFDFAFFTKQNPFYQMPLSQQYELPIVIQNYFNLMDIPLDFFYGYHYDNKGHSYDHELIKAHLYPIMKTFQIFKEISEINESYSNLDFAISKWCETYGNLTRLSIFGRDFSFVLYNYIFEIELYEDKNNIFMHDRINEILKTSDIHRIKIIPSFPKNKCDFEPKRFWELAEAGISQNVTLSQFEAFVPHALKWELDEETANKIYVKKQYWNKDLSWLDKYEQTSLYYLTKKQGS